MLRSISDDYVEQALSEAEFDKLEDGMFSGHIPGCKGVVAFGGTLEECKNELGSTLEDWISVGLELGHPLPVLNGYSLNQDIKYEAVETV